MIVLGAVTLTIFFLHTVVFRFHKSPKCKFGKSTLTRGALLILL